jgi:ADP-heptose:LPS heptosyltransferase
MIQPGKILAIQFKYLGDLTLMVPALRALRQHWPQCELHVLAPDEGRPLLEHLPWVRRVWGMPRRRGRVNVREAWPIYRALRQERFDFSVDFGGNDRGAIASWLCGARRRLGWSQSRGWFLKRLGYTEIASPDAAAVHQSARLASLLGRWNVPPPDSLALELHTDPSLDQSAQQKVPGHPIVCHITASKPRKEWPLVRWVELQQLAEAAGLELVFSSGPNARERAQLSALCAQIPQARSFPASGNLAEFLALLKRASLLVSGDTGPLHFAAALGVPTVALYGPTKAWLWAPLGPTHRHLLGAPCTCKGRGETCYSERPCLAGIPAALVLETMRGALVNT